MRGGARCSRWRRMGHRQNAAFWAMPLKPNALTQRNSRIYKIAIKEGRVLEGQGALDPALSQRQSVGCGAMPADRCQGASDA